MASFNSVVLLGNLTRDPELRYTPEGVPVCSFALAVNGRTQSKEDGARRAALFDVEAWRRLGEISAATLKKGRQVLVLGELCQDLWVDPASKRPVSKIYIVAQELQFLGGKGQATPVPVSQESAPAEK